MGGGRGHAIAHFCLSKGAQVVWRWRCSYKYDMSGDVAVRLLYRNSGWPIQQCQAGSVRTTGWFLDTRQEYAPSWRRDTPTSGCKQSLARVAGKQSLKKPVRLTKVKVDMAVRHWAKMADFGMASVSCGAEEERRLENLLFSVQIHSAGDLWPLALSGSLCATCENVTLSVTC